MLRGGVWSKEIIKDRFSLSSFFPILAVMVALLLGGVIGLFGTRALLGAVGAMIMAFIFILRQDELAATIIIAVDIYIDLYLDLRIIAVSLATVLLLIFYLRSPRRPWAEPRALGLWGLLLVLAIYPSIHGALGLYDASLYYPNIFFGAFIFFWLGTVLAPDTSRVRRLFKMLTALAALLAIHTIIAARTGVTLFASTSASTHYGNTLYFNYHLGGLQAYRIGGFFVDPNWNGTFFAMTIFLPLGLFAESSLFREKAFYLIEMVLILLALLFTYSAGAWVACIAGLITFVLFVGQTRYRVQIPLFIILIAVAIAILLPTQVKFLLLHASDPQELIVRNGGWATALRVILAFPLTGVGLGMIGYAQRVQPYLAPIDLGDNSHPHDSYLELGAMAGIPLLITFVALVLFALWLAFRNWAWADIKVRSLLAGGIAAVIALSINSISINGWTLPPLAATGWLILGAISSPLLAKGRKSQIEQGNSNSIKSYSS